MGPTVYRKQRAEAGSRWKEKAARGISRGSHQMILVRGCQESVGGTEVTSLVMLTLLASCPRCVEEMTPSTSQLSHQITVESHLRIKGACLGSKKLWHGTGWRWQPCPSTFPHKTLWTTEKPWVTDNYQQVTVSPRIPVMSAWWQISNSKRASGQHHPEEGKQYHWLTNQTSK